MYFEQRRASFTVRRRRLTTVVMMAGVVWLFLAPLDLLRLGLPDFGTQSTPRTISGALASPVPEERFSHAGTAHRGECSVVLYGDSILHGGHGVSMRLSEPPAQALRKIRPSYAVDDQTVNGETATVRASYFALERRTARFVVIAHGINDVAQGLPLEASLRSMILAARREGREVILTGLSHQAIPVPGRSQGDAMIRRLAKEMKVGYANWGSVAYDARDLIDAFHPGKPYSDRLVRRIVNVLDQLAPECAEPEKVAMERPRSVGGYVRGEGRAGSCRAESSAELRAVARAPANQIASRRAAVDMHAEVANALARRCSQTLLF